MILPNLDDIKNRENNIKKDYPLLAQLSDMINENENLLSGFLDEDIYGGRIIFKYCYRICEVRQNINSDKISYLDVKTNDLSQVIKDLEDDLKKEIERCNAAKNASNIR